MKRKSERKIGKAADFHEQLSFEKIIQSVDYEYLIADFKNEVLILTLAQYDMNVFNEEKMREKLQKEINKEFELTSHEDRCDLKKKSSLLFLKLCFVNFYSMSLN